MPWVEFSGHFWRGHADGRQVVHYAPGHCVRVTRAVAAAAVAAGAAEPIATPSRAEAAAIRANGNRR